MYTPPAQQLKQLLLQQDLLSGLSEGDLDELSPYIEVVAFEPNRVVFNEGDLSNDIYVIFDGSVEYLKDENNKKMAISIGKAERGDLFGELSFLDNSPRTCAVKSLSHLILIKIVKDRLESAPTELQEIHAKIVRNIAIVIISRLRKVNRHFAKSTELDRFRLKLQNQFGRLFLKMVAFIVLSSGIAALWILSGGSSLGFSLFNWTAAVALVALAVPLLKEHHIALKVFGMSGYHWKRTLLRAIASFALAAIAVAVPAYLVKVTYFFKINTAEFSSAYLLSYPFYVFLVELSLRAIAPRAIEKFSAMHYRWESFIYIAVVIAACNLPFGVQSAFIALCIHATCALYALYEKNVVVITSLHLGLVLPLQFNGFLLYANFT